MSIDMLAMRRNRDTGTPGPWSVTKDGKHVCGPAFRDGTKPSIAKYANANAARIASVPELEAEIECLRTALETADDLMRVMDFPIQSDIELGRYEYKWAAVDDALGAYRTARGAS